MRALVLIVLVALALSTQGTDFTNNNFGPGNNVNNNNGGASSFTNNNFGQGDTINNNGGGGNVFTNNNGIPQGKVNNKNQYKLFLNT